MKTTHTIDYSEARRAVDLIVEKALHLQKAAAVAIADSHGDLIYFVRMDGAPVSSIQIAMNKAWTAARERKPTREIGDKVKHPERGHDIAYYADPQAPIMTKNDPQKWAHVQADLKTLATMKTIGILDPIPDEILDDN